MAGPASQDVATQIHARLHAAVVALRALEWEDDESGGVTDAETSRRARVALASALEAVNAFDQALSAEFADGCRFVRIAITEHLSLIDHREVTRAWMIDALSSVESGLLQLRELANRLAGSRSMHGPSATARATKCRSSVARLLRLARDVNQERSPAQRARLVGTGIANLLGSTTEGLLSIQGRHLMKGLRKRLHFQLTELALGRDCPDAALLQTLSDACATLELLRAQTNIELREHDEAAVAGARAFLDRGDHNSARFVLASLTGFDEALDAMLAPPAPVFEAIRARLDELGAKSAAAESLPLRFDSWLPSPLPATPKDPAGSA